MLDDENIYEESIPDWILEAQKDHAIALEIIESIARRLVHLQQQNDVFRVEQLLSRRSTDNQQLSKELEQQKLITSQLMGHLQQNGLNKAVVIFVSANGNGAKLAIETGQEEFSCHPLNEQPILAKSGQSLNNLILLSTKFRVFSDLCISVSDINTSDAAWGKSLLKLSENEKISLVHTSSVYEKKRYVVLVTKQGFIKLYFSPSFYGLLKSDEPIIMDRQHDYPIQLIESDGGNIILVTSRGRWVNLRLADLTLKGGFGIKIQEDDRVLCALALSKPTNIYFGDGFGNLLAVKSSSLLTDTKLGNMGHKLPFNFVPTTCFSGDTLMSVGIITNRGDFSIKKLDGIRVFKDIDTVRPQKIIEERTIAIFPISL